jgi:hypothetical protein
VYLLSFRNSLEEAQGDAAKRIFEGGTNIKLPSPLRKLIHQFFILHGSSVIIVTRLRA